MVNVLVNQKGKWHNFLRNLYLLTKFGLEVYFDMINQSTLKVWKNEKYARFSQFPDIFRSNDILGNFGTKYFIGTHNFKLMSYKVTKYYILTSLCKNLDMTDFVLTMIFIYITQYLDNYDVIQA